MAKEKKMSFDLKKFLEEKIAPPKDSPQTKAVLETDELLARRAIQHRRAMEVIKSDHGNPAEGLEPARIPRPFSAVLEAIIASPTEWSDQELVVVAKAIASRLLTGANGLHRVHYGSLQGVYPLLAAKKVSVPIDAVVKKLWEGLPATTGIADVPKELVSSVQAILAVAAANADRRVLMGVAAEFLRRFPGLPDGFIAVLQETAKFGSLDRRPWEPKSPRADLRPRAEDKAAKAEGEAQLPVAKPDKGPAYRTKRRGLNPEKNPALFADLDRLLEEEANRPPTTTSPATAPLGEAARVKVIPAKPAPAPAPPTPTEVPVWQDVAAQLVDPANGWTNNDLAEYLGEELGKKAILLIRWKEEGALPAKVSVARANEVAKAIVAVLTPPAPEPDYSDF